jgi:hypothetical protein
MTFACISCGWQLPSSERTSRWLMSLHSPRLLWDVTPQRAASFGPNRRISRRLSKHFNFANAFYRLNHVDHLFNDLNYSPLAEGVEHHPNRAG